jgi:NAD(P)-dependent dehydrogenase (short-subunit alcohol dehydrogenase family)
MFSLDGKVAIVTGGASGIGLAITEVLLEHGARVTILDRDAGRLGEAVERLRQAGHTVRGATIDVTNQDAIREAFAQTATLHGAIDIVFANAGISGKSGGYVTRDGRANPAGELTNYDFAEWHATLGINLDGVFLTIREAARHMKPRRSGRIIVTTSFTSLVNLPIVSTSYTVSKAAAAHLMRNAALELAPYNILVNGIAPGIFATNIAGGRLLDPAIQQRAGASVPLGRVALSEEIKGVALFLASPASSYVTGAHIVIDGGLSLGRASPQAEPG